MISKAAFNPKFQDILLGIPVLLITPLQAPPHRYIRFDLSIFKQSPLHDFLLDCEVHQRHVTFAQWIMGNHELCRLL